MADPSPIQQHLQSLRTRIEPVLQRLAASAPGALLTRVHGDFHLGQILVVQDDAYLIDFEGEPARPPEERRAKTSPLRDMAGFLRSLDYAAAMLERGEGGVAATVDERTAAFLTAFRQRAGQHFRAAYCRVLHETANPWAPREAVAPLLALFLIEKGAYEIAYEAANRPVWIDVPVRGLAILLDELLAEDGHD